MLCMQHAVFRHQVRWQVAMSSLLCPPCSSRKAYRGKLNFVLSLTRNRIRSAIWDKFCVSWTASLCEISPIYSHNFINVSDGKKPRTHQYSVQHIRLSNTSSIGYISLVATLSVLWRCWLGGRKGIRPVLKTEWWGAGVVIGLERGADLHMAQLMPLPLTVSCFSKI